MHLRHFNSEEKQVLAEFFAKVFGDSEGEAEGKIIGKLVSDLIGNTPKEDLMGFVATSQGSIIGAILLSRLVLPSKQLAFILAPVAIATEHQGKGVGQQLIKFGIEHLKSLSVDLVFTYGDPRFYSKVGFGQLSESVVKAPFKLTYPDGWLAQSLEGSAIQVMEGRAQCVDAFNDERYW